MDLEVARKALSKRSAFLSETRRVFRRNGSVPCRGLSPTVRSILCPAEVEQNATVAAAPSPPPAAPTPEATESLPQPSPPAQDGATAPTENVEPTGEAVEAPEAGEAVEHAEQPEPPGSGMILVSRQPVAVLASPSSSAPTMYGFPAGRPFRVIGHDGGFAQYPGAAGLTRSARAAATQFRPPRLRLKRSLSQSGETLQTRRPVTTNSGVTADSEAATQHRRRPGLFGRGGVFGGIFRNSN